MLIPSAKFFDFVIIRRLLFFFFCLQAPQIVPENTSGNRQNNQRLEDKSYGKFTAQQSSHYHKKIERESDNNGSQSHADGACGKPLPETYGIGKPMVHEIKQQKPKTERGHIKRNKRN